MTAVGFAERVADALQPLCDALDADGYVMDIQRAEPGGVSVVVSASETACADCLAPRAVFVGILADALATEGVEVAESAISVLYPSD